MRIQVLNPIAHGPKVFPKGIYDLNDTVAALFLETGQAREYVPVEIKVMTEADVSSIEPGQPAKAKTSEELAAEIVTGAKTGGKKK